MRGTGTSAHARESVMVAMLRFGFRCGNSRGPWALFLLYSKKQGTRNSEMPHVCFLRSVGAKPDALSILGRSATHAVLIKFPGKGAYGFTDG